jgi:hypothetical protein
MLTLRCVVPAALSICVLVHSQAMAKAKFATFDPPGSTYTHASAINASGTVAGYYVDSNNAEHGFVRTSDGTITTIDVPGASDTEAEALNDAGVVIGWFFESGLQYCFIRATDGTFTTFDPSNGAALFDHATGITSKGVIAGYFQLTGSRHEYDAYVRDAQGNVTVVNPGGAEFAAAQAINSRDGITGSYAPTDGPVHGFVRTRNGKVATFDVSGDTNGTMPADINAKGWVTGYDMDGNDIEHGFVRSPDGTITAFDPSGSTSTQASGINAAGAVTGNYFSDDAYHGFVRAQDGTVTTFDVPGGTTGTVPLGINDKGAVTGWFEDSDNVVHGFLRTP